MSVGNQASAGQYLSIFPFSKLFYAPKSSTSVSLLKLTPKLSYRSNRDDLVGDFYNPCLIASGLYRRSAGYFTSSGLALAARGVARLIAGGGKMRLIVSPHLEPGDIEALQNAIHHPVEVLARIAARSIPELEDALIRDRLNALAWLAASGGLEVKLALRLDERGLMTRGLYHEKIGIFSDSENHHIAFSGSSNETAGGLVDNFESVEVFCSWQDPEGRVASKIDDFERMWENDTPGLRVIQFTEASTELLERFRNPDKKPEGLQLNLHEATHRKTCFSVPKGYVIRDYQKKAIRAWSEAGGQGVLAMATGSGKTFTALTLASLVAEKNTPLVIIVICPFLNLCKQWMREMAAFGLTPLACYEGKSKWLSKFGEGYQRLTMGISDVHAIVTTNRTFQSETFQSQLRHHVDGKSREHHLLIADEVHNLGAKEVQKVLPEGISLRLGLSATPERHLDPEGTTALLGYFGDIVFEFGIKEAIAAGHLCRYRYHPQIVTLTEAESEEYAEITAKLGPMLARAANDEEVGQMAMNLLIKRSRLLASAENKVEVLDQLLDRLPEKPSKAIFYCGDGRTTDKISDEDVRQIEAVARMLGEKHGLRVRNFTYRESPEEREEILRDLSSGFLDGVVAIRCLDEGIDVPDLKMGFLLASSSNPRQFVQRRGRLLRKAQGKNRAEIYDFIIAPPDLGGTVDDASFNLERSFFQKELKRIAEFCQTAENGPEAKAAIRELCLKYNLISQ
ncbi:MAG: DNA phosphorothioation system restriction enzyme [Akkermansiaceae bacterium]